MDAGVFKEGVGAHLSQVGNYQYVGDFAPGKDGDLGDAFDQSDDFFGAGFVADIGDTDAQRVGGGEFKVGPDGDDGAGRAGGDSQENKDVAKANCRLFGGVWFSVHDLGLYMIERIPALKSFRVTPFEYSGSNPEAGLFFRE